MSGTFPMLLTAIGLGIVYAALPGVVSAEALRRGVEGGSHRAFFVYLGGQFGAAFWAILALTGTTVLERHASLTMALSFVGIGFLLWLAWGAFTHALHPPPPREAAEANRRGDVATGAFVGIANPAGLPFWAGIASGVVAGQDAGSETGRAVLFVLGVMAGSIIWSGTMSVLIGKGRRYLRPGFFRGINGVCAIAFLFFASQMLWAILT